MFTKLIALTSCVVSISSSYAGTGFIVGCPLVAHHSIMMNSYKSEYSESANPAAAEKTLEWTVSPSDISGWRQGPHGRKDHNMAVAQEIDYSDTTVPHGKFLCTTTAFRKKPYKVVKVTLTAPIPENYTCRNDNKPGSSTHNPYVCFFKR